MLPSRLHRFVRDRNANIAVMVGLSATVLIGVVAFAVDEGSMFTDRRTAQSAVDLAALSAASSPPNAPFLANATVKRNRIALTEPLRVQTGTYVADPSIAVDKRFKEGPASSANAVRVTLTTETPTYFGKLLHGKDKYTVRTTATAANTAMATFSIGTRLASLNGGVINQLLSQTLGGTVDLTVMDYQSLADLHVDMFDFLNAVATEARLTGPTYNSILTTDIGPVDAVRALSTVARGNPVANSASLRVLSTIEKATRTTAKIKLRPSIDLGPYANIPVSDKPAASLDVSAFEVLSAAARLADGAHQVDVGLALDVPMITSTSVRLTIGERPVSSGWTAVGRPGATVETAQTRLALRVSILPANLLASINLPIYLDIAKGTATLVRVKCPSPKSAESVTLAVTPGIAEAWIADLPTAAWDGFSVMSSPQPAALAKVGLVQVMGQAHVRIGNQKPTDVTFSASDIRNNVVKTVATKDYLASLTSSLLGDLKLAVKAGGLGIALPGDQTAIKNAIAGVAAPIDEVIFSILTFLGIGLGEADVRVQDVRCDGAVLVN